MLRLQNALTFVAFAAVWLASSGLGEKKVTVSEFPGTDLSDLDGNDVGPSYGGLPGSGEDRPLTNIVLNRLKEELSKYLVEKRMGHMLRVIFHDCVGGCDGCLSRAHIFHTGIWIDTLDMMDRFFDKFNVRRFISRADFYNLCAIVSIENGYLNANPDRKDRLPLVPFTYGRVDCPTSPDTPILRTFPLAQMNHTETMDFYDKEFGMNVEEVVAISGAHTLGEMSGISGYKGFSKGNEANAHEWDTGYYRRLLNPRLTWVQENQLELTGLKKWLWTGRNPSGKVASNMLNADICLVRDTQTDHEGRSACDLRDCKIARDSVGFVRKFRDFEEWMKAFSPAYLKLTSNGSASKLLEPTDS